MTNNSPALLNPVLLYPKISHLLPLNLKTTKKMKMKKGRTMTMTRKKTMIQLPPPTAHVNTPTTTSLVYVRLHAVFLR